MPGRDGAITVLCIWWSYRRLSVPGQDNAFHCSTSLLVSRLLFLILMMSIVSRELHNGKSVLCPFSHVRHFKQLTGFQSVDIGLPRCCYFELFGLVLLLEYSIQLLWFVMCSILFSKSLYFLSILILLCFDFLCFFCECFGMNFVIYWMAPRNDFNCFGFFGFIFRREPIFSSFGLIPYLSISWPYHFVWRTKNSYPVFSVLFSVSNSFSS